MKKAKAEAKAKQEGFEEGENIVGAISDAMNDKKKISSIVKNTLNHVEQKDHMNDIIKDGLIQRLKLRLKKDDPKLKELLNDKLGKELISGLKNDDPKLKELLNDKLGKELISGLKNDEKNDQKLKKILDGKSEEEIVELIKKYEQNDADFEKEWEKIMKEGLNAKLKDIVIREIKSEETNPDLKKKLAEILRTYNESNSGTDQDEYDENKNDVIKQSIDNLKKTISKANELAKQVKTDAKTVQEDQKYLGKNLNNIEGTVENKVMDKMDLDPSERIALRLILQNEQQYVNDMAVVTVANLTGEIPVVGPLIGEGEEATAFEMERMDKIYKEYRKLKAQEEKAQAAKNAVTGAVTGTGTGNVNNPMKLKHDKLKHDTSTLQTGGNNITRWEQRQNILKAIYEKRYRNL